MDNIVMAKMENAFENGRFSVKKASKLCASYIKSLLIKTPSEKQKVKFLSGGNQQKVAVGKWLTADCEIKRRLEASEKLKVLATWQNTLYNS